RRRRRPAWVCRRGERDRRGGGAPSAGWGRESGRRRPAQRDATGEQPRQLASRELQPDTREGSGAGRSTDAVVSPPPEQASPLVARREPDLPVPPGCGPAPERPLVGGDRGPTPLDRVR